MSYGSHNPHPPILDVNNFFFTLFGGTELTNQLIDGQ